MILKTLLFAALISFFVLLGLGCEGGCRPVLDGRPCSQWADRESCVGTSRCGWCEDRCVHVGDPTEDLAGYDPFAECPAGAEVR